MNIGIDVGGVLRGRLESSNSLELYLSAQPTPKALEVMKWLTDKYGEDNIFIISKCPKAAEQAIILWLEKYGFFDEVGIKKDNVFFCRSRADKADIAKTLKIKCFIDDRAEVLEPMNGIVDRRVLFAPSSNNEKTNDPSISLLEDWGAVRVALE